MAMRSCFSGLSLRRAKACRNVRSRQLRRSLRAEPLEDRRADAPGGLRIELAADYLVMAAWLAYLKSRLLLPEDEAGEELEVGRVRERADTKEGSEDGAGDRPRDQRPRDIPRVVLACVVPDQNAFGQ